MSQDQIESRRAFMKKLGKLTGAAAVAAPFMAMAAKEVVAAPDEDNPRSEDCRFCEDYCSGGCKESCSTVCGGCDFTCQYGCNKKIMV